MAAGSEPELQVQTLLPAITYPVGVNQGANNSQKGGQYILASQPTQERPLYIEPRGETASPCYIRMQKFEKYGEVSRPTGTRWVTDFVKLQMQEKANHNKIFSPAEGNLNTHSKPAISQKWTSSE